MKNLTTSRAVQPALPGREHSSKSVLSNKRGLSTSLTESLGGIVLGVIIMSAAGLAVGVAVNVGHDSTAKATLDSVKTAEVLQMTRTQSYGDKAALSEGAEPALIGTGENLVITATATNYCAVIKSKSLFAPTYWITAKSGKVLNAAPTATDAGMTCPTVP